MVEQRKADIKRVVEEVYNKGNLDVMDEFQATNVVSHRRPPFPDIEGLEAVKQTIRDFRSAFPDLQLTIDEIIVEGDRAALRWTLRGTHTGKSSVMPVPPTGKQVTVVGCTIERWVGGKMVEQWMYSDNLGMMQQLGVIPPLEQGGG